MRRDNVLPRQGREAGFTLIEMLVALVVMIEMILAVLLLFDFTNKLSRVQTNVSEMQQSLRVSQYDTVRLIRMVGRGPLPIGPLTALGADATANSTLQGVALSVRDNVPTGAVISTVASAPVIVAGSDVLTVRGVFSTPLYLPTDGTFVLDTTNKKGSFVVPAIFLNSSTGVGGIQELLGALVTAVNNNVHEALVLVSSASDATYAVVELDPPNSNVTTPASQITIAFKYSGDPRALSFIALSPGGVFPPTLTSVKFVGILEEYRVYVRSFSNNPPLAAATAADKAAALNSKLSRARMFPNTEEPYGPGNPGTNAATNAPNLQIDVADDVIDLQVALGFDSGQGGGAISLGTASGIVDNADAGDDWLYNSSADNPTTNLANWNNADSLYYIRLSTLVRTDRPDPKYTAPLVTAIEDNSYASSPFNLGKNLMFRRRILQTVIDLRNMG
jgi:type II secretory pathway pseudopilin PulG